MRIQMIGGFIKWICTFHKICSSYRLSPEGEFRLGVVWAYFTRFEKNASKTARYFGLHRNTVTKYLDLYDPKNLSTLEPKSTVPIWRLRKKISPQKVERIKELKKQYPAFGKEKIRTLLLREGLHVSSSTIGRIFTKHNLTYLWKRHESTIKFKKRYKKKQKKKRPPKIFQAHRPGWWIQIDTVVVYHNGSRYYVINAVDLFSRFVFSYAYTSPSSKNAAHFLEQLIAFFPDPCPIRMIQTDNGSEFHKYFDSTCTKYDIQHTWSYPKTPKMNPYIESFNKTIQLECLEKKDVYKSIRELNFKIQTYLIHYNTFRPHSSIWYKVPLWVYCQYLTSCKEKVHTNMWTCSSS